MTTVCTSNICEPRIAFSEQLEPVVCVKTRRERFLGRTPRCVQNPENGHLPTASCMRFR